MIESCETSIEGEGGGEGGATYLTATQTIWQGWMEMAGISLKWHVAGSL